MEVGGEGGVPGVGGSLEPLRGRVEPAWPAPHFLRVGEEEKERREEEEERRGEGEERGGEEVRSR